MREKIPRFTEEFQTDDKTVKHTKYCKALRFVYKGAKGADAGEMKFHLLAT